MYFLVNYNLINALMILYSIDTTTILSISVSMKFVTDIVNVNSLIAMNLTIFHIVQFPINYSDNVFGSSCADPF